MTNNTEPDARLDRCPFCGAGETHIHPNKGVWSGGGFSEIISVEVRHWCPPEPGQPSRGIIRVGRDEASAIAAWNCRASIAASQPVALAASKFQQRVQPWLLECFGAEIAADRVERNHRFLEESLELVQSLGCTASEAHQLVDYVFCRPVGDPPQEAGGVMVTLAALCLASGLDMHDAGEVELARISAPELVAKIRAKQAAKPKHSPLPIAPHFA